MKKMKKNILMALLCPLLKSLLLTLTIDILLILAFSANKATAQEPHPIQLAIGQRVPEQLWSLPLSEISSKTGSIMMLKDFKGKPIIIDFWASWCQPCLVNMPMLDSLARKSKGAFQPLMVNTKSRIDSLKDLNAFLQDYLKHRPAFASPIVRYSPLLQAFFPHHVVPHYVWIGADGKLKAITDHNAINTVNLDRFSAGATLDLPLKLN